MIEFEQYTGGKVLINAKRIVAVIQNNETTTIIQIGNDGFIVKGFYEEVVRRIKLAWCN